MSVIFASYALQSHNTKILNKYSQKRYCAVSLPMSAFMCLWPLYLFPPSGLPILQENMWTDPGNIYVNRSQTHECGIWDWGRAIPFLGIHNWDFRCSVCLPNLWVMLVGHEGFEADNPARCAAFYQQDLCQVLMWKAWTFLSLSSKELWNYINGAIKSPEIWLCWVNTLFLKILSSKNGFGWSSGIW